MQNQIDTIKFTPEKSKQIALARLDLIHKWLEFRRKANNKLQADYDFVNLHNTSNSHLFQVIGKISRGSLHRAGTPCLVELTIIKSYYHNTNTQVLTIIALALLTKKLKSLWACFCTQTEFQ